MADEQQPDSPPDLITCPNCFFQIDCETATNHIQAAGDLSCPNCLFDLTELTKDMCPSASNQ